MSLPKPKVDPKPVPKTQEEIQWFMEHMGEQLGEVKSIGKLTELWTFNAVAVKSLPENYKAQVIQWKDEAKARVS